jgi:hypothetical protein
MEEPDNVDNAELITEDTDAVMFAWDQLNEVVQAKTVCYLLATNAARDPDTAL